MTACSTLQGVDGPKGENGDVGAPGLPGQKGDVGDTGAPGIPVSAQPFINKTRIFSVNLLHH